MESSGSGFVFHSDPRKVWEAPDLDGIADADLRQATRSALAAKQEELGL